jgi:hypothetical protein
LRSVVNWRTDREFVVGIWRGIYERPFDLLGCCVDVPASDFVKRINDS